MRIVTLNIRHGGGSRVPHIANYLAGLHPDVVVLTEFRGTRPSHALADELVGDGLTHVARAPSEAKQNSVAVLANTPFEARPLDALPEEHQGRVLAARFPQLELFAAYFPQRRSKAAVFELFLSGRHQPAHDRHLLIGDLNTGRHQLDEAGRTFYCTEQFEALSGAGLIDVWRTRNLEAREYSWFSSRGRGFRIDHAFASPRADRMVTGVFYDHEPRIAGITDHSALIVDLAPFPGRS